MRTCGRWLYFLYSVTARLSRVCAHVRVCTGGVLGMGAGGSRNLARDLLFLALGGTSLLRGAARSSFSLPAWPERGPVGKREGKSVPNHPPNRSSGASR